MSDRMGIDLRQHELAFFGAVTASLSHQINNVLTIVNELGGLVSDMAAATPHPVGHADRLGRIAERIHGNVERGTEYIRVLNRFSHTVDQAIAEIDPAELVQLVAAISQRFAELRQVQLEVQASASPPRLRVRPFHLLHALFVCVQGALTSEGAGRVTMSVTGDGASVRFLVAGDGISSDGGDGERGQLLAALCEDLGASFSSRPGAASTTFAIVFDRNATGGNNGEST